MKSLEERKKQRVEQRQLLAHGGVIPLPSGEGQQGVVIDKQKDEESDNENGGFFDNMDYYAQKQWAADQKRPVPGASQSKEDVTKYVTGLKEYMDANNGQVPPAF